MTTVIRINMELAQRSHEEYMDIKDIMFFDADVDCHYTVEGSVRENIFNLHFKHPEDALHFVLKYSHCVIHPVA